MSARLPVLCPQEYEGMRMNAVPCTRCRSGWDKASGRCVVPTGAEHLSPGDAVPECPIGDRCQHQIQGRGLCVVRSRGFVCESALVAGGLSRSDAMEHPLSFHADMME